RFLEDLLALLLVLRELLDLAATGGDDPLERQVLLLLVGDRGVDRELEASEERGGRLRRLHVDERLQGLDAIVRLSALVAGDLGRAGDLLVDRAAWRRRRALATLALEEVEDTQASFPTRST